MQFGANQKLKFNAKIGSYSIVTAREHLDSQITATENIHIGNVASGQFKALKPFRLYPDGNEINLNLVFPKPNKTELRLYLSLKAGFKPEP
jgi:5-methylcytosine-specific restriction enzyme A